MSEGSPATAGTAPCGSDLTHLLSQQAVFYETDARPYDEWVGQLLDEDNRKPEAVAYRAQNDQIRGLIAKLAPRGSILEIAAGTGRFTALIADYATELVLLDASPSSLAIAKSRLRHPAVEFTLADVFTWQPLAAFDVVCFAAWLHHVPESWFEAFWKLVDAAVAPSGWVLFNFAEADGPLATASPDPPTEPSTNYAAYYHPTHQLSTRDLSGNRWQVVHQIWAEADLRGRLREIGWTLGTHLRTPDGFCWATARRR